MEITHKKSITRPGSLFDIESWYKGESEELEKWIGMGFYNHLFNSRNNLVVLYYDLEEAKSFEQALDEKLTEELFDNLCDNFYGLIENSNENPPNTEKDVFDLSVKIWPALTIFHEISNYPDWATESMLRRLIRIRATTEAFSYQLSKKIDHSKYPKDYVYFKGDHHQRPFEEFLKENNIKIV